MKALKTLKAYKQKDNKPGIQIRIFLPVLLILAMFPIASLAAFMLTSEDYFERQAVQSINELAGKVDVLAEEIFSAENAGEEGQNDLPYGVQKELSVSFMKRLRQLIRNENSGADALAISSKYRMSYPDGENADESIQELYNACVDIVKGASSEAGVQMIHLQNNTYAARILTTSELDALYAKYVVCYVKLPETDRLVAETGKLMMLVTAIFLLIAAAFVWKACKSISAPIERLADHALSIEGGSYQRLEEEFELKEPDELRRALNTMCTKLESAECDTMRFFQNVSHDLRTPLVSIGGYAQGIETGQLTDTKKAAEIILSESKRMTELVDSILVLSRLDNQALKLMPVIIPVGEFLQEQAEIMERTAMETQKRITVREREPGELYIHADAALLIRIVQNIFSNCLRYAEHEVTVSYEKENDNVKIVVADDGEGISEEELPNLFHRFYSGENGRCGFGLSIIKNGTEYMGGNVRIENRKKPMHGAVYTLCFPPA